MEDVKVRVVPPLVNARYCVCEYELNRYNGGYGVQDTNKEWGRFEADFPGLSLLNRERAQALADKLNGAQKKD